jgi:hypothetical protein
MGFRIRFALLVGVTFAVGAIGAAAKNPKNVHPAKPKIDRHDPAYRAGYMDGYRQGSNDSEALSNAYKDESGPVYSQADEGYTAGYGDLAKYQESFRLGYIDGYKAGWDFNSGQYNPLGAGTGGGSGG